MYIYLCIARWAINLNSDWYDYLLIIEYLLSHFFKLLYSIRSITSFGHTFFLLVLWVFLRGNYLTRDGLGASQGICQHCLHLSSRTATLLDSILQISWLQLTPLVITFITSICHWKITVRFSNAEDQIIQRRKELHYAITIPKKFFTLWLRVSASGLATQLTAQIQALGK